MLPHTEKGKERKRGEEGEKKKLCEYTQVEQTGKKKKKKNFKQSQILFLTGIFLIVIWL